MKHQFFAGSDCGEAKAGLRVFDVDSDTGEIRQLSQVQEAVNPIYLAASGDGKYLYAAQMVAPGADGSTGGVAVYAVSGWRLEKLAEYACAPTVPCHISLSRDGSTLVYAEYQNAWAGVFAVRAGGLLEGPIAAVHHVGHGPNAERQEAAHCHCAVLTPDDRRLCVCDLGLDRVFVYDAECRQGLMREIPGEGFVSRPGAGPRHLMFHPAAPLAFLVTELDSTVVSFRYAQGGLLNLVDTYPLLPGDFTGDSTAAAIKISPDGKWLLASNRGHDSITVFAIDEDSGRLERKAVNKLTGKCPRDFEFAPDGKFVVLGHQLSNEVAVYSFDSATGIMQQAANTIPMIKPLCFVFALQV